MTFVVNHIGIPVSDLERSTEFYLGFGGRVVISAQFSGPDLDRLLDLKGVQQEIRHILIGSVIVELLHYTSPPGAAYASKNSDVGAAHIGFQVDDLPGLYKEMSGKNVEFLSEPMQITEGPFAGGCCVFCRDPDGISVELLQPGPGFAEILAEARAAS